MAAVRAYKIAEELGIDRNDFVARAKEAGIEIKSAMATLDDAQAALLREKLSAKKLDRLTEARLEVTGGAAVIRRRKRVEPEPAPVVLEVAPAPLRIEPPPTELAPAAEPEIAAEADAAAVSEAAPAPAGAEDDEEGAAKGAGRSRVTRAPRRAMRDECRGL